MVALLRQEDRETYRYVVDTWKGAVYNTVLNVLQNESDAEDVTQDVFIQVFESIEGFKEESKFSTWLYRIAVSKSIDHLRRKKSQKRFAFLRSLWNDHEELQIEPVEFVHPGVKLEEKENAAALLKALEKLPLRQKTAFVLNKMEKLSYREIGEIMNLSVSAVDSLLQRARQNLKLHLKNYFEQLNA